MTTLKHSEVIAAAAEAASRASAAAAAVSLAICEAVRAETTRVALPECLPFAETRMPGPDAMATRRRASHVSLWRIHFHCPACRRHIALVRRLGGQRVSCPKCYTGIRVPDPAKNLPAQNLGRTLEPLLRPGSFAHCADSGHGFPWRIGRLSLRSELVAAAGLAILLAGTTALAPLALRQATQNPFPSRGPSAALASPADRSTGKNWSGEARLAVEQFLAAPTPGSKAAWVVDAGRTASLMADWYARRPGGGPQPDATITGISQGFYAAPGASVPVSEVTVNTPEEGELTYLVEHRPEGARIAWPESVAYSPVEWSTLLRHTTPQARAQAQSPDPDPDPVPLRVLACRDDYYNYSFNTEEAWCCVRLHDPRTRELLGYGYVPRSPFAAASLAAAMPDASGTVLRPITVAVRPLPDSPATKQVKIIGQIAPGWKHRTDGTVLAQR